MQCEARTLNRIRYASPEHRCRRAAKCAVYDHYRGGLISACNQHGRQLLMLALKRLAMEVNVNADAIVRRSH